MDTADDNGRKDIFGNPALPDVDEILIQAQQQHRQLAALRDATSSFLRREARLGQLRERTLLLRSRAKFEWKTCHDYRRFVRQSQETFNEEAAAVISHPMATDYDERATRLRHLHDQVMRDFDAQNAYAQRANDLQTELGALEYELQIKEASMKEATEAMKRILSDIRLPAHSSAATVVETEVSPSTSTQPSEDLDPLIDRYFQKLGVLNRLLEESVEIEVDYAEARAERDFKAEHDQTVETTDEAFETWWRDRRNNISQQIVETREVADRARNVCLDDGLDPEMYRRRSRRESDRSVSDSMPLETSQLLPPPDDVPLFEKGGFLRRPSPSEDDHGTFRVLTPGTLATRISRVPRSQTVSPAPLLKDRVLDWMQELDRQDDAVKTLSDDVRQEVSARRSLPASRAPTTSKTVVQSLDTQDSTSVASKWQWQDLGLQKRCSSDSNIAALLFQHDPDSAFVEGLRKFASE